MPRVPRSDILARFRAMKARGEPIIGAGAGTGISAKGEEEGGADLIVIYNSGRYRMAGRGSLAGMMPFGDANGIVVDMARELDMEAGVPVAAAVDSDGHMVCGVLPAGRYATLTHVGHPSELAGVTETLLDWAAGQGLTRDTSPGPDGDVWGGRLEIYLTDPAQEPDMSKWVTQLAFRLAD